MVNKQSLAKGIGIGIYILVSIAMISVGVWCFHKSLLGAGLALGGMILLLFILLFPRKGGE